MFIFREILGFGGRDAEALQQSQSEDKIATHRVEKATVRLVQAVCVEKLRQWQGTNRYHNASSNVTMGIKMMGSKMTNNLGEWHESQQQEALRGLTASDDILVPEVEDQ